MCWFLATKDKSFILESDQYSSLLYQRHSSDIMISSKWHRMHSLATCIFIFFFFYSFYILHIKLFQISKRNILLLAFSDFQIHDIAWFGAHMAGILPSFISHFSLHLKHASDADKQKKKNKKKKRNWSTYVSDSIANLIWART